MLSPAFVRVGLGATQSPAGSNESGRIRLSVKGVKGRSITRILNTEKVPLICGGKFWHVTSVTKLLADRRLIGELRLFTRRDGECKPHDKDKVISGYFPVVIPKSLFAVVAQMKQVRPSMAGRCSVKNPFAKLITDPDGGAVTYVTRTNSTGRRFEYLVPYSSECGVTKRVGWRLDHFLPAFCWVTKEAALTKPPEAAEDNRLAETRLELRDCEGKIRRLISLLERVKSADVEKRLTELDALKQSLQQRISELETEAQAKPAKVSDMDWTNAADLRSNLLRTIKKIVVSTKERWFKVQTLDNRNYAYKETVDKTGVQIVYMAPNGEIQRLAKETTQRMKGFQGRWLAREQAKVKAGKSKAK
jgi:hypothetical protein